MKSLQQVNSVPESTQLNGTTDNLVKQPQSSNKKKPVKSAASVETAKPIDTVANGNSIYGVQSPQLFTDEIGIADGTRSATQSDVSVATDIPAATTSSDVADALTKSEEHKSTDISAETSVMVEPSVATATAQPDTSAITDEAKATRVSRKQSRGELEDYKADYLAPFKIGKRHTVVLDDELWKELDYIVRRIGDSKANATAYANSIIRSHLAEIRQKVEAWRKL